MQRPLALRAGVLEIRCCPKRSARAAGGIRESGHALSGNSQLGGEHLELASDPFVTVAPGSHGAVTGNIFAGPKRSGRRKQQMTLTLCSSVHGTPHVLR